MGRTAPGIDRHLLATWYAPLLSGLLPVLVVGFLASGMANRLVFVGWALAVAVAYTSLLRVTVDLGWAGRKVAAAGLGTLAVGFGAFAALVERHGEILDLGYRALLPDLHLPLLTRPAPWLGLAVALAVAAVARLSVGGRHRSLDTSTLKDVPS